jgi:hypothetical protein
MSLSYLHAITEIYVWVDDLLPKRFGRTPVGRPRDLSDAEIVTIWIWNELLLKHKTWKDLHRFLLLYHQREFPTLPKYNAFLHTCHRAMPKALRVLRQLLAMDAPLKFLDSTMLPVCTHKRADDHRVAKGVASFGRNHQGWHYGFKLHTSVNGNGLLSGLAFTSASMHEKHVAAVVLGKQTRLAVGDCSYGGAELKACLQQQGVFMLTPAFPNQKKLTATWQILLLSQRSKIESVFDYLKNHLHLVTSFPRSVMGYFVHYVMVLLGYQVLKLLEN